MYKPVALMNDNICNTIKPDELEKYIVILKTKINLACKKALSGN